MKRKTMAQAKANNKGATLIAALFAFAVLLSVPFCIWAGFVRGRNETTTKVSDNAPVLRLAYSPEKAALFQELLAGFEKQKPVNAAGKHVKIQATAMPADKIVQAAVNGEYDAVSPDSSLWLSVIDSTWIDEAKGSSPLVGETTRYALSPVVIAVYEDVARSLGYPDKAIGWKDILEKARSDSEFGWSHASPSSTASGLLATLAQFYAGVGKTRGLTVEDATADATLKYVADVQRTVKRYGEGELTVIDSAISQGRGDLDAFVVQEQLVIYYNSQAKDKLVAIYPAEGTLWEDHPLALLESPNLTAESREVYQLFKQYLLSADAQQIVLQQGYRPADLSISLDASGSPISQANGVDPRQPQTVLQMPSEAVVNVVRDVWWYTKRHTNVYLVVDSSGSMAGDKITKVRQALLSFVASVRGDEELIGLIDFGTGIKRQISLSKLGSNRNALNEAITALDAGGNTALVDAVASAYSDLQRLGDTERINAIVVMTDGKENASQTSLRQLESRIHDGNKRGVPVYIFCVAYGRDADKDVLKQIAEASGGQVRESTTESIEDLYKLISTYF